MDDYGYITAEDAEMVAAAIAESNAVTFSFSHENGTANQIWMAKMPVALSKLQHMGADQGFIVGIYGAGTYIFNPRPEGVYENYVSEKLYIPLADAAPLTLLINSVAECLGDDKFSSSGVATTLGRHLSVAMTEHVHFIEVIKDLERENQRLREKCGEVPVPDDGA